VPTATRGRYRSALGSRDLRLLLAAFLTDSIGGWAYNVVLVVYVFERTGSPGLIAATTACGWVPRLLFSAYAGVLADRYERTRLMTLSALSCFVVGLTLAGAVATDQPVVLVLALHATTAVGATFYTPAARALVPEAVPERDLAAANAVFGVCENVVVVVGPAIGALLLLTGEPALGVLFNALTFLGSAAFVQAISLRSQGSGGDEGGLRTQVATGLKALRDEPVALVLVLYTALDSAVFGATTVLFVPLSQRFGTGTEGYGYLTASMAVGGVLAGFVVDRLSSTRRLAPVIVGGMCVLALPVAAAVAARGPVTGALLMVLAGAGMVVVDVLSITALQRDLPRAVLSRVFGVFETLVLVGILLASAGTSALLTFASLDTTLLVVGLGISAASVLFMAPLLRADRRSAASLAALHPRVAMLEVLDLLAGSPRATLEQLARALEEVQLPAGQVVLREGDPADALYVVVSGEVAVSARGEGRRSRRLRTLGARSYFGEIGLLRGGVRTATVRTTEPTVLWRLPAADFSAALEHGAVSSSLLSVAGARLARSHPSLAAAPFVPEQPGVDDAGDRSAAPAREAT
jgi:CRP-like cAMP-binding protein/predicted MFS family arabinose efflux permease